MVLYTSGTSIFKRVGGQIMNAVMAPKQEGTGSGSGGGLPEGSGGGKAKKPRAALGV